MKKSMMKRILAAVLVGCMAVAMSACGAKEPVPAPSESSQAASSDTASVSSAASEEAPSSSAAQADAAGLSEEDYKAKVKSLMADIETKSTEAMKDIDLTNVEALVKATSDMIEQVKPMYEELSSLQAPAKYADAQTKIKTGVDASLELLNLSLDMIQNGGDAEKVAELQAKTAELGTIAQDLNAGLEMLND